MTAFEQAWSLLKALPGQQMYSQLTMPVGYGFSPSIEQQRLGTVHPAIAGMMSRLQRPDEFNPQPDLRVAGPMPQLNIIDSYRGGENHAGYIMQPTQLSSENYQGNRGGFGRHPLFFEGERSIGNMNAPSLFLGESGDLDTGHLNIPQADGGTITNNAPIMPIDSDGRDSPRQDAYYPYVPEPKGVPDNFDPMALDETTLAYLSRELNRR
jgi:hypothetical protein